MFKLFHFNHKIVLLCLCIILTGCITTTPYRYRFSLVTPKSETLNFEDDTVQFGFVPSPEHIKVTIRNKGEREIHLVRDKSVFVNHLGESRSVLFGQNFDAETRRYISNDMFSPPMRIGPGSEIMGNAWINIGYDYSMMGDRRRSTDITYLMKPLFPRNSFEGKGEDLKNSTFNLILPIDFDGHISSYTFTFMINDVIE